MKILFKKRFNLFDVLGLSLTAALLHANLDLMALAAAISMAMLSILGERTVERDL